VLLNQTHLTTDSVAYTITFYPNDDLDDLYRTNNPKIATAGSVLIMFFTSILFFLYDFFVHKEFRAKSNLLTAKRQFVRYVSHEVRTPLNSVCMGLTLLQEEIALSLGFHSIEDMMTTSEKKRLARSKIDGKDDEWFQLASEVQTNAQSSVDVLNDLLNYDKIESGTLSLELQVLNVWELIEQTVSEFKLPAATKKIHLDLKFPGEKGDEEQSRSVPSEVRNQKAIGDAVRITQVLRNLVSNALKFTPENASIHVEARWRKTGPNMDKTRSFELKGRNIQTSQGSGELVLNVKDTGAGMTKEQLSKLFGQGVQFNVNVLQAGQGSGLGLYIAKGIAEQHEGTLVADSTGLGCGTTFTLTIPLYHIPDEKPILPVTPSERKLHASVFKQSPLRVLIVDDAATNRKLLGRLLKLRGHSTEETEDGHFAVEMVRDAEKSNNHYDMVLLDYEMPILNGPSAAMEIRATGSDVFIVGITGNMMAEDVEYFRSCGANAVLPKPFKMSSLEDLVIEFNVGNRDLTRKSVEDFNSYNGTMKTVDETDNAKSSSGSEAGHGNR
jgi:signal transduction histidine kinase/CheY-like chemotaxis protein